MEVPSFFNIKRDKLIAEIKSKAAELLRHENIQPEEITIPCDGFTITIELDLDDVPPLDNTRDDGQFGMGA